MNEERLIKYAVDYLSKYNSSKNNLLKVLKRKIFRLTATGIEKKKLINSLQNIIEKLEKNNLINDERYTLSKISFLSRSGKSKNFIIKFLINKGITKIEIQNILNNFTNNNDDWEFNSAKLFAKKKKLLDSNDSYEKKLGKMARAGFSYDISKKILG